MSGCLPCSGHLILLGRGKARWDQDQIWWESQKILDLVLGRRSEIALKPHRRRFSIRVPGGESPHPGFPRLTSWMESDWIARVQSHIPVEAEVQIDIATFCITASCKSRNNRLFAHGSFYRRLSSTGYLISHCPLHLLQHYSPPAEMLVITLINHPHLLHPATANHTAAHPPLSPPSSSPTVPFPVQSSRYPGSVWDLNQSSDLRPSQTRSGPTAESDLVQVLSQVQVLNQPRSWADCSTILVLHQHRTNTSIPWRRTHTAASSSLNSLFISVRTSGQHLITGFTFPVQNFSRITFTSA